MHVILRVPRDVVIDHMADPGNIQSPGRDVCRHKNLVFSRLETLQSLHPLCLRPIGMQRHHGVLEAVQLPRNLVRRNLGARENDATLEAGLLQDRQQQVKLLVLRHRVQRVCHRLRRRPRRPNLHHHRVLQYPLRHRRNLGRQRCRKKQGLPLLRTLFHDPPDLRQKPHVQHPIHLVQHQKPHVLERNFPLFQKIQQPAWGRHNHIRPRLDLFSLPAKPDAALNQRHLQIHVPTVVAKRHIHLRSQFPGRLQHQTPTPSSPLPLRQLAQDRQRKSRRLARARLSAPHQIPPTQNLRDGARLDGRRLRVPHRLDPLQNRRRQTKILK